MLPPRNIVILRPGALGDVLVCRHLLAGLKAAFPKTRRTFIAPGERGKLLWRFGLADVALDWENAAFSWLFSTDTPSAPPELLRRVFTPGTVVLAYLDLGEEETMKFRKRFAMLNTFPLPLRLLLSPSRPPDGTESYIGEWMARNALKQCGRQPDAADAAEADLIIDAEQDQSTLVIHPGSGSAKKNWPLSSFAGLAEQLTAEDAGTGLKRIRIVTGEADGDLGERLAAMLPAKTPPVERTVQPTLTELANILASAAFYLGNDSGVTHLASAVRTRTGTKPKVAAVFGPSDPGIWTAPDALTLRAGRGLDELPPETAFSRIHRHYFPGRT